MIAGFQIHTLQNYMRLVISKNNLGCKSLYKSFDPLKKRYLYNWYMYISYIIGPSI